MTEKGPAPEKKSDEATTARHPLEIALAHPVQVVLMFGTLLGMLYLALYGAVNVIVRNHLTIPNVVQVALDTNQVVVPAAAGWVAVNPDRPFEDGTTLSLRVSGRVQTAIRQAIDAAQLGDEFMIGPPDDTNCEHALRNLHSVGRWTAKWRSVDDHTPDGQDKCRLSPNQHGGKLVYAILKDPPDERLGLIQLEEFEKSAPGVLEKGYLGSKNSITLQHGGYMILAVNDRLNCDSDGTARRNAEKLKQYLGKLNKCRITAEAGTACIVGDDGRNVSPTNTRDVDTFYDLTEEYIRDISIGDNAGEYFVHVSER